MKLRISIAERRADVLRCQYFIAETYNKHYGIMFSEDEHDLEARIEPYPQRYLMGTVDGELVAAVGLYTRETYVERYGSITDDELLAMIEEAGVRDAYPTLSKRELTKLVVKEGWEGFGLARLLHTTGHATAFLEADAEAPVVVLVCAKISIIQSLFAPRGRVNSRFLAPFPRYPIHSDYRSDTDTMESRMSIPAVDVPADVRAQSLPIEIELPERRVRSQGAS